MAYKATTNNLIGYYLLTGARGSRYQPAQSSQGPYSKNKEERRRAGDKVNPSTAPSYTSFRVYHPPFVERGKQWVMMPLGLPGFVKFGVQPHYDIKIRSIGPACAPRHMERRPYMIQATRSIDFIPRNLTDPLYATKLQLPIRIRTFQTSIQLNTFYCNSP